MAAEKYTMKQYDLEPPFEIQLLDGTVPIDLTNATSVLFIMKSRKGLKVLAPMLIADQNSGARGVVLYRWQDGDTNIAGSFNAEIQVAWPGARAQTFPASQYVLVTIEKDLNQAGARTERHTGTFALHGGSLVLAPLGRAYVGSFLISSGDSALTRFTGSRGILDRATFTFTQTIPAQSWDVVHNLGRPASVTVVDVDGHVVGADVTYVSENEVLIEFTSPFAGQAYLS